MWCTCIYGVRQMYQVTYPIPDQKKLCPRKDNGRDKNEDGRSKRCSCIWNYPTSNIRKSTQMRIQYSMKSCTLEGYAYGMVVLDEELVCTWRISKFNTVFLCLNMVCCHFVSAMCYSSYGDGSSFSIWLRCFLPLSHKSRFGFLTWLGGVLFYHIKG